MKFLVDNQLPSALARVIESEFGEQAVHVSDIALRNAADADLWAYATENGLVLISKDEDFVRLALTTRTATRVWVRVGNCRRDFLLSVFRRMWRQIVGRLEQQDRLIEIR